MQKLQLDEKSLIFLGACMLATQYESTPFKFAINQAETIYDLVDKLCENNNDEQNKEN